MEGMAARRGRRRGGCGSGEASRPAISRSSERAWAMVAAASSRDWAETAAVTGYREIESTLDCGGGDLREWACSNA